MKAAFFVYLLYFDHNATTPVAPEVADVFTAALRDLWGNPSSIHRPGQHAREALERSRRTVAEHLGVSANEIVFTSGGTESNNLALLSMARNLPARVADRPKHIVTTTLEHPAVLGPVEQLRSEGVALTLLHPNRDGVIDPDKVVASLRPETVLISVMHANNEVGTLQPVQQIAAAARAQGIYLHCDGVQAAGRIPVELRRLGVHTYAISGHKLNAPKGIGALFVAKGTPLSGIQLGGRHERGRRAGTENVAGALALACAFDLPRPDTAPLRDEFERQLTATLEHIEINGRSAERLPNTSSVTLYGLSAEALLIALDMLDFAVSTGSACSSGSTEPSPVLLAMGRSREEARATLRISFGRGNTQAETDQLAAALIGTVRRMRKQVAPEVVHA